MVSRQSRSHYMRTLFIGLAAACLLFGTVPAWAEAEIDALRAELEQMKADYEDRIAALEERLDAAERKAAEQAAPVAAATEPASPPSDPWQPPKLRPGLRGPAVAGSILPSASFSRARRGTTTMTRTTMPYRAFLSAARRTSSTRASQSAKPRSISAPTSTISSRRG